MFSQTVIGKQPPKCFSWGGNKKENKAWNYVLISQCSAFFWALLRLWCPHAVEQRHEISAGEWAGDALQPLLEIHLTNQKVCQGKPRAASGFCSILPRKPRFWQNRGTCRAVLCLLHLHLVRYCRLLGWDFADQWLSASSAWEAGISWLLPSSSPSWAQGSRYTMAPSVCLKQGNYAQKLLKEYKVVKSSEKCYNIACSAFNWILRACKFDSL